MMRRTIPALLGLLSLSLALPALAADEQTPWYEVEVVVFRQWQAGGADAEQTPPQVPPVSAENVVSLRPPQPGQPLTPYAQLSPSEFRMQGIEKVLEKSGSYEPLLHVAWRQPGLARADTPAVALPSGWQPSEPPPDLAPHSGAMTPMNDGALPRQILPPDAAPRARPAEPLPPLYGLIKVYRERYIHAMVDLRYQRPGGQAEIRGAEGRLLAEGDGAPVAINKQTRRMQNSGELHYLDHPTLGVLIQVTPVETAGGSR